jgi:cytochrome c biogenesis protein CcmG, thiol:disulfide interchange protein DsbE
VRYLRYLIPLAAFVVLTGFLMKGLWMDPHTVPSPLIDKPAPQFRLTQVADPGKSIGRDDMLGKVWLLNVWASWCVSCREEHPVLVEFAKTGIVPIYGLDYKDTRDEALKWLDRLGNPYQASLFDPDGRVGIDYGVYGVPETFLIDKTGVVRYKQIGPLTVEALQQKILPLVRQLQQ